MTDIEQRKKAALEAINTVKSAWPDEVTVMLTHEQRETIRTLLQPTPSEWQVISTAPRDGSFITGIWWSGNVTHGFPFVCQWDGEKWTTPNSTGCTVREPSHWSPILPLPSPPIGEKS